VYNELEKTNSRYWRDWGKPLTYLNGDCLRQRYEASPPEYKIEILPLELTYLIDKRDGLTEHMTYIYDENQKP
jgi:hypothetical protein